MGVFHKWRQRRRATRRARRYRRDWSYSWLPPRGEAADLLRLPDEVLEDRLRHLDRRPIV